MAHIQDRWERTIDGERVRTTRYGKGKRWQAHYRDPDGHERTKDFARKADAERFLATITADVLRGLDDREKLRQALRRRAGTAASFEDLRVEATRLASWTASCERPSMS